MAELESNLPLEPRVSLASKALLNKKKVLNSAPPWSDQTVVICRDGIPANTLVTHYRGEVYPPWRWGEKLDAIDEIQKKFNFKIWVGARWLFCNFCW